MGWSSSHSDLFFENRPKIGLQLQINIHGGGGVVYHGCIFFVYTLLKVVR